MIDHSKIQKAPEEFEDRVNGFTLKNLIKKKNELSG
jgi:hypothetical protein